MDAREAAVRDQRRALDEHDQYEKRDEALRIGGNYMNVKDESCPPYTPFYLIVNGHI